VFGKIIWSDAARSKVHATVERRLELPFVPCLGLEVYDGCWSSGPIERFCWDVEKQHFYVHTAAKTPYADHNYEYTASWYLEAALKDGWS
jgi:hypothetical protein